ncbi:MAG: hypothetical protein HDR88_09925 [Bacteroides sp.]|nr:hypothetical protein [Bacteroides sp.]
MNFWKVYLRQLPKIVLHKDGISNTLCLRKTIWVNFKCINFKSAYKLPIWIYRHTKINSLGNLIIECDKIQSGIIKIGSYGNASREHTILENYGSIIFRGSTSIFRGCYINNNGIITFEGQNLLSEGCTLKIMDYLKMGKMSRFGSETYVIDTDFHYTIDIHTSKIKRNTKGITIGEYNWFGTRSFIKKGVKTGYGFIIAAPNTVLIKDYSTLESYTVLGGNPARPIASGISRIFNTVEENRLKNLFIDNLDIEYTIGNLQGLSIEKYCAGDKIMN